IHRKLPPKSAISFLIIIRINWIYTRPARNSTCGAPASLPALFVPSEPPAPAQSPASSCATQHLGGHNAQHTHKDGVSHGFDQPRLRPDMVLEYLGMVHASKVTQ